MVILWWGLHTLDFALYLYSNSVAQCVVATLVAQCTLVVQLVATLVAQCVVAVVQLVATLVVGSGQI